MMHDSIMEQTLKQIQEKLKNATPNQKKEEERYIPQLESEMSNLEMIKERLRMLSTKNKSLRQGLEVRLDMELNKSQPAKPTVPRKKTTQTLETENLLQRQEIEYLKRVNEIQRDEIEKLRSIIRKQRHTSTEPDRKPMSDLENSLKDLKRAIRKVTNRSLPKSAKKKNKNCT